MKNFNLTEWSLKHQQLVYFFVIVAFLAGIFSYLEMGRSEDPNFTIRQMVVYTAWPGADAKQVEEQVTDKIEKKLEETPGLKYLQSYSRPGLSVIYVTLKDEEKSEIIRSTWLEVRNMVNDIKQTLPEGVKGPFFNDRFDDVFGSIYALTGDGYNYEELRQYSEDIRQTLLGIDEVSKVELIGVQPEKIYIEMNNNKLAQLGIDPGLIIQTLRTQNAITPSGKIETNSDNVNLRVSGVLGSIDNIEQLGIRANGRTFRLSDIAYVYRDYIDPIQPKMYFNGQPAVGLAVSMTKGGNILLLGESLKEKVDKLKKDLPLGVELHQVSDQPKVVEKSINEFVETLFLAVLIVLVVSFLSLGFRAGIVVALCIPLVIATVFACMKIAGIDLHKISLGALIIALGLLVDDAIIAVEMTMVKMEEGWDKFRSACYAYSVTAYPRLVGALVTCAGFMPIAFSLGNAAEYVGSLFWVVTMALLTSWLVAGAVTPLLGYNILVLPKGEKNHQSVYQSKFYLIFRQILEWCLHNRWLVIGATFVCFITSLFLLGFVKNEFFPPSTRPELIVEMRLPEGASLKATEKAAHNFSELLKGDPGIVNYVSYVGKGSPRFVLVADVVLDNDNYAQFVILTKNSEARNQLKKKIDNILAPKMPNVRIHTKLLANGPPAAYPVMFRVSGPEHDKVRSLAESVSKAMAANPAIRDISFNWFEKVKSMHLEIDQDKARMMGIDNESLALSLQTHLSGIPIAEFRERDKLIDIVFRMDEADRKNLAKIRDLNIHLGGGKYVPLEQIAKISYRAEDGLVWRRDRQPTITVQGEIIPGVTGNDVAHQVFNQLKKLREQLPPGYEINLAGSAEDSKDAIEYLLEPVPMTLLVIMTILMFQLQSISKMFLVLLTAPLGIIGVSWFLLIFNCPMGFVAQLGIIALAGIIIRNSVILIDQISQYVAQGQSNWEAITNAAVLRFRPIMLTAGAAILAMIPLFHSTFWGAMAVAIAGGLLVATVLTLLVLPAMYAALYNVKPVTKMVNSGEAKEV